MTQEMIIYIHPTCSTCKRALIYLAQCGYEYQTIDIRQTPPPKSLFEQVLAKGMKRSSLLNSSGELYKQLGLKDKLADLSDSQLAALLAKEGMLVKRPVICKGNQVTFGARESVLEEVWKRDEI